MQRLGHLHAATLVAALALVALPAWAAEATFPTPEDAVTAYIEGVAHQDFKAIFAATAVDEMSKGFDFIAYVDRVGAMGTFSPVPSSNPLYVQINRATFVSQIAKQLQFLAYGLMTTSEILEAKTVRMEEGDAAEFDALVDASRLSGIALIKVGAPSTAELTGDFYQSIAARQAATYGADESTERVALIAFEGGTYMVGFSMLRFGDEWKVSAQFSPLAGTDALGVPLPATPEEFEAALQ